MKRTLGIIAMLISLAAGAQTVKPSNQLIIDHSDIKLYLDDDTSTMISAHTLKYADFKNLKSDARCDCWFVDKYSKLNNAAYENAYRKSGYDFGHLTPSHIVTYTPDMNKNSFSYFNQAPQISYFNEHPWQELEKSVEKKLDSAFQYSQWKVATIITGVIYNNNKKEYLSNSRIKIPTHYYKIVTVGDKTWIWIAENTKDKTRNVPKPTTLLDLNKLFAQSGMRVQITK